MKRLVSLLLAALMAALVLSSCAVKKNSAGNSTSSGAADTDTAESAENKEQSKRDLLFTWQSHVSEAEEEQPNPEYRRTRETRWEDGGTTLQA